MDAMTQGTTTVTNEQIARDLNISDSMVSRIRKGDRFPSFELQQQIERTYHWTVAEQARQRAEGKYAKALEYVVARHYVQ